MQRKNKPPQKKNSIKLLLFLLTHSHLPVYMYIHRGPIYIKVLEEYSLLRVYNGNALLL
jgi:hypothetical protein